MLNHLRYVQNYVELFNALHPLNAPISTSLHLWCSCASIPYRNTSLTRHVQFLLPCDSFQHSCLCKNYPFLLWPWYHPSHTTVTQQSALTRQLEQHVLCSTVLALHRSEIHCFRWLGMSRLTHLFLTTLPFSTVDYNTVCQWSCSISVRTSTSGAEESEGFDAV